MIVRPYQKSDEDALVELWYRSTVLAHDFVPAEKWHSHKEDLRERYLPIAETWVAEEKGKPVGFISLLGDFIGGLFVDPDWQGRGAGSSLVKHVQDLKGKLKVAVYQKNSKAKSFYEKMGFVFKDRELQDETGEILENMEC